MQQQPPPSEDHDAAPAWLEDLARLMDRPGAPGAEAGIEAMLARLADPGFRAAAGPGAAGVERILGRLLVRIGRDRLQLGADLQKARFAAQHRRRDRAAAEGRLTGEAAALGRLLAKALALMPPWRRGRVFDAAHYLHHNPDVAQAGARPLRHYLTNGAAEGRLPADLAAIAPDLWQGRPGRMADLPACPRPGLAEDFPDSLREDALRLVSADPPRVSVVIPVRDRAGMIGGAVASALTQALGPLEVIVIDDGSTDGTPAMLRDSFPTPIQDGRLVLVETGPQGVSAARNTGLDRARGDVIAYLDSDNSWEPDHLLLACAGMRSAGARIAYTALNRHNVADGWSDILFRPFDRAALEEANYIDLNAVVHEAELVSELGGFDTSLTRLVDWDLLLRFTERARPVALPVVTGHYLFGGALLDTITGREPLEPNLARIRARLAGEAT